MTINKMIEIMDAYTKGAEIEFSLKTCDTWDLTKVPTWNWYDFHYRVKEESKEIELFEWMLKSPNNYWIISTALRTEEDARNEYYIHKKCEYKKTGRSFLVPKDEL